MYVPQLPTDNLYKFLAISGLVMIIVSYAYTGKAVNDLAIKGVETETTMAALKIESDHIRDSMNLLKAGKDQGLEQWNALREKNLQVMIKSAQLNGEIKKQIEYQRQAKKLAAASFIGSIFGVALAFSGFILWYLRVQKPADMQALHQLGRYDT